MLALCGWGEKWAKAHDEGLAVGYVHVSGGKDPGLGTWCQSYSTVLKRGDLVGELSAKYAQERKARAAARTNQA
jgi:hypothetical protein